MAAELKEVELEQLALTWPQKAKALAIVDQQTYDAGGEMLVGIAGLKKEIIAYNKEPKQLTHAAWKSICEREKRGLDPLEEGEKIIKLGMGTFIQKQRQIEAETQRRRDEEARRIEEEARLALAQQAEEAGAEKETVEEILDTPRPIQRMAVVPQYQKPAGIGASNKPVYRWELINKAQVPDMYKKLDEVALNAAVKIPGMQIPGIRIYEDIPNISVRARR